MSDWKEVGGKGMTIDEAIVHIQDLICENNSIKPNMAVFELEKEALYMAIEALKEKAEREKDRAQWEHWRERGY